MAPLLGKLRSMFTDRPRPDAVFGLSAQALSGILAGSKGRAARKRFVLPLDAGSLTPSFDKPNGIEVFSLAARVEEGKEILGLAGGTVAVLIPEICVRVFVLAAESLPGSDAEREAFLRWRVAKQMPIMPDDLRLACDLSFVPGPRKILVAAAREAVVREYEALFSSAGLKPGCVTIPTLSLANLVDRAAADGLLLSAGTDHLGLLAAMDAEWTLYRLKGLDPAASSRDRIGLVVQEAENTVHFLEDREQRKISRLWVHSADGEETADLAARLESVLSLPAERLEYGAPREWASAEKGALAPLVGQLA